MKKIFIFPLLTLALSSPVDAGGNEQQEKVLNTVIVTGGRTELGVTNRPATYLFSQIDIEQSPARDLTELLAEVPGLSVDNSGGRGANANVRIRGSESDHVLILIDGVRSASASSGTTSLQNIPLSQIDRIEVVKGPKSGIYGADALGGVIQIFTKKGKNSTGGYVDLGYGSHSTSSFATGFNDGNDTFYYGVNLNHVEAEGVDRQVGTTGVNQDKDGYIEKGASFNIGRDVLSGFDFDLVYTVNQGNTEFDSNTGSINDNTDFKHETVSFSSKYNLSSIIDLNVKLGYFKDDQQTSGSNTSRFTTRRDTSTIFLNYDLSDQQNLVIGHDYYDDKVASTSNFDQGERANKAAFAEYALSTDAINLQVVYRNDDNESTGKKDSGSIYGGLPIGKNHEVSLSYGEAFKLPTFNDLFFPFTDFGGGFTYQGNPNLLPESSKTTQFGYAGQYGSVAIDFSLYRTKIKNLIQGTASFDTVENIGQARLFGGELAITQKNKESNYGVAFSHVDAINSTNGNRLTRRSGPTVRIFADKTFGKLTLSSVLFAEGGRKQTTTINSGGYTLVDLGAKYQLSKKNIIDLKLKNVFDKGYALVESATSRFTTEGRTFNLSYQYLF